MREWNSHDMFSCQVHEILFGINRMMLLELQFEWFDWKI